MERIQVKEKAGQREGVGLRVILHGIHTYPEHPKHQCSERDLNECLLSQTLTDGTVSTLSTAACRQCRRPATTDRIYYMVSI